MMARTLKTATHRVRPRTESGRVKNSPANNSRTKNRADSSGNRRVRAPRKAMAGIGVVLMGLFFIQGLFYVWCRVQCVNAGYGIDREMNQRKVLLKERSTLNIELNWLKSPERIETFARHRLGLVMPDAQQTVRLP